MTRNHAVTVAPTNIVGALNLDTGTTYTIEVVVGATAAVRLWEGPAAPDDRSYFHSLTPRAIRAITPEAGVGIWVWRAPSGAARLVVTDDA